MANRSKTWWGREFLAALERFMDSGRLARGRSYSGPRRIVSFAITGNRVTATLEGNINHYFGVYETPYYKVEVTLTRIAQKHWKTALERLGDNANWVAHLILGEMPPTIERALTEAPVGLLPASGKEIRSTCSCPDRANPCKHVAGVYYRVARMIDYDPFLLFELRGLDRKRLFEAVRKSEFGAALGSEVSPSEPDLADTFGESRIPVVDSVPPDLDPGEQRDFWLGNPLPRDPAAGRPPPPVSVLPMRRAGDYPEFWQSDASFLEAMGDAYERIAKSLPTPRNGDLDLRLFNRQGK